MVTHRLKGTATGAIRWRFLILAVFGMLALGAPAASAGPIARAQVEHSSTWTPPSQPNVVARAIVATIAVFQSPHSQRPFVTIAGSTPVGTAQVFLTADLSLYPGWVRVYLPIRPDGVTGWIQGRDVALNQDPFTVLVRLGAHQMTVYRDSSAVISSAIGVGRSVLPTPLGTYYIVDLMKQPSPDGVYGPYAFGLSAYSNVLQSFGGGPGEIGLHGTDDPSSVGANVSHGCLRVANATILRLAKLLPVGTPVVIRQ